MVDNPALDARKRASNRALSLVEGGSIAVPTPRRIRLRSLDSVAVELAKVYRGMRNGEIRPEDGSRFAFVLTSLGKVLEASSLERRIAALEQAHGEP